MRTFIVKQKLRLGGERFDIKDDKGQIAYRGEGSFFKIRKSFRILDAQGQEVSRLVKPLVTLTPHFKIEMANGQSFYIRKKITLFRDKYKFDNLGLRIEGNILDMNFRLLNNDKQVIAEIGKQIFNLTSTYKVTVYDEAYSDLVISLCVAIDYVEELENREKVRRQQEGYDD